MAICAPRTHWQNRGWALLGLWVVNWVLASSTLDKGHYSGKGSALSYNIQANFVFLQMVTSGPHYQLNIFFIKAGFELGRCDHTDQKCDFYF